MIALIIAIMTIMVLDLKPPHASEPSAFFELWPSFPSAKSVEAMHAAKSSESLQDAFSLFHGEMSPVKMPQSIADCIGPWFVGWMRSARSINQKRGLPHDDKYSRRKTMVAGRLEPIDRDKMVYIDEYFQKKYVHPMVALRELYELLEAYGPMWYTRETRILVQDALKEYYKL